MTFLIAVLSGMVGMAFGYVWARKVPSPGRQHDLEVLLVDVQQRHETFQRQVSEHFRRSAELVNALSHQHRALHDHLQSTAAALIDPAMPHDQQIAELFEPLSAPTPAPLNRLARSDEDSYPEPPRDYATKLPSDKGMLDERFGLK